MAQLQNLYSESNQTKWTVFFSIMAVAIFGFSGWAWWHYVRSNPERTFYSAVENSLRSPGTTRHVQQSNGSQTLDQQVQLLLNGEDAAHGFTTIKQTGEIDATVKTETISTPSVDYVRYTDIQTTQKSTSGQPLDFKDLIGKWGKADATDGSQQPGELFNESILGVVPVANLAADKRDPLMDIIHDKNVYDFDAGNVKHELQGGRPVYTYQVTVKPEAYVTLLKEYGKTVGLAQLQQIEPANYKDSEPLKFELTVDVWSQHLTRVKYIDNDRTENLSSYGVVGNVDIPTETVPLSELQNKLQSIQ